jgi:glycosyltransferase involved in cell wall biosynthesis
MEDKFVTLPLRAMLVGRHAHHGGAARALSRIYDGLRKEIAPEEADFRLRVVQGADRVPDAVEGLPGGPAKVIRYASWRRAEFRLRRQPFPKTGFLHSAADVWTGLGGELDRRRADILNIHWIGTGTISIEEIGRLRTPIVWTLHDMWAFCGAEHYMDEEQFATRYASTAQMPAGKRSDPVRAVWERKVRAWTRRQHAIAPSRWLADCAQRSVLMHDWQISVIPNPIDTCTWSPGHRSAARKSLGLPLDRLLVLFVAHGGAATAGKGMELLDEALARLGASSQFGQPEDRIDVVLVGNSRPSPHRRNGFRVHDVGRLSDDVALRNIYRAADIAVVPSRIEAFGQVAAEAQACGTPVIAFGIGGLLDIVEDGVTGRLAEPFDTGSLAAAMAELLADSARRAEMGSEAVSRMRRKFSPSAVARQYLDIYCSASDERKSIDSRKHRASNLWRISWQ